MAEAQRDVAGGDYAWLWIWRCAVGGRIGSKGIEFENHRYQPITQATLADGALGDSMKNKSLALSIAGLLLASGAVLLVERGGLFAWAGTLAGIGLLIKILARPSAADSKISALALTAFATAWIVTYLSIVLIWETGEIAELHVETSTGVNTTRVWVLDFEGDTVIFYDAEPEDAASLRGDPKISVTRRSTEIEYAQVQVISAEAAPAEAINRIYEGWHEKYGNRNLVTPVYSLMFGRSRTKEAFVITLTP